MAFEFYLKKIGFQQDEIDTISEISKSDYILKTAHLMDNLLYYKNTDYTLSELHKHSLRDDKFDVLTVFLIASYNTLKLYQLLNIDITIYYDTMKCFKRFINESKVINSSTVFDRDWWCIRQVSMKLFRIKELEYELLEDNKISIHIPSDSSLCNDKLEESFNNIQSFIAKHFPNYLNANYYCESWLLSPNLKQLINEKSKILIFQSYFNIVDCYIDNTSFFTWVFKQKPCELNLLNENTTLQRSLKKFLIEGNEFHSAKGYLKINGGK